ncbi:p-aminobenzoyl-glutamate transport protein [Dickeya solani]|nr:p-aminobenzoyl-glutamate transport protein [Dickeya solani]QKO15548.1 p-aminobenzoyl-glutamate transport protein [Dickeya solani]
MSVTAESSQPQPGGLFQWVERIGNKIPNPFLLFVYLIAALMAASALFSWFGITATNPANGEVVRVKNLLSVEGLQWILPNVIKNFSGFTPLGAILALVLGPGWRSASACCKR